MTQHLPMLVVAVPLTTALAAPLAAWISPLAVRGLGLAGLGGTLAAAVAALRASLAGGALRYEVAGWAPPWGIELVVDPLGGAMAVLVAALAILVALYGVAHAAPPASGVYWALFLLLVTGLLGIAVTGDLFNLFVFLEIAAIAGYALLGTADVRSRVATFRYLLVGTLAGSFYLLGVGYLYALTGTLNMADLARRLPEVSDSPLLAVAIALIAVGLATKSALFPLHGWLPDVYSYAPPVLVTFVAAVTGKVTAYALFRILYFVLPGTTPATVALELMGWAAALAVVAGSVMALAQDDFRRLLAYSSVAQMGYIFLGFSIGNAAALTGALLHVLGHAVMKGSLFMIASGVTTRRGRCRLADMDALGRDMPVTTAALAATAVSMMGVPPGVGFFSKYNLILGAVEAGAWPLVASVVTGTLLGVVYFMRVLERALLSEGPGRGAGELTAPMLVPLVTLASAALLLGVFNQAVVDGVIRFALPPGVR